MCVLWGVPYLLIKVAVAEVSVPVVVFCRTALGALVLLPLALRPGVPALLRAHWMPLAGAPLIAVRRLGAVPGLQMTAACLTVAALVYAVPAALTWPERLPSAPAIGALVALGLLCTAVAFVGFFALIREVGPSRATTFTYVNPAVAAAAGMLVLGETLPVTAFIAFGLILLGCVLATRAAAPPGDPLCWEPAEAGRYRGGDADPARGSPP